MDETSEAMDLISDRTSPNSDIKDTKETKETKTQTAPDQPETFPRAGGWLFRHRTATALPVALALLIVPAGEAPLGGLLTAAGIAVTAAGELLRLWAVRHIGTVSRTRSERLGPLVETGPFEWVRNPLYIGNLAIWTGFALMAHLVWLAPVVLGLLGLAYHAIVHWEERLLAARLGEPYVAYTRRVPRWIPRLPYRRTRVAAALFSWRDTLFSERGTLIAIAAGYLLIWLKLRNLVIG
jgi:protein-S-isoprenylcysteine O-methyltransferase Ste14